MKILALIGLVLLLSGCMTLENYDPPPLQTEPMYVPDSPVGWPG